MASLCSRLNDAVDLCQFLHQILLIMQTSCGVADQHITASCLCRINGVIDHRCRVRAFGVLDDIHAGTLCPDLQLVNGSRTERICRSDQHLFALAFQLMAQLADGGGLACAVDADHHDDGGLCGIFQRLILAQHLCNDLLDHAHDLLGILYTTLFHTLAQGLADLHRGLRSQVAGNHGLFQFVKQVVVDLGEPVQHLLHPGHHGILCLAQSVTDLGEKAFFLRLFFRLGFLFRFGFFFRFSLLFRFGLFLRFSFFFRLSLFLRFGFFLRFSFFFRFNLFFRLSFLFWFGFFFRFSFLFRFGFFFRFSFFFRLGLFAFQNPGSLQCRLPCQGNCLLVLF